MIKILIISTCSLAILSITAYFLYSFFFRQTSSSFYRLKRNKKSDWVKKEIQVNELLLKTYQELIMYTVKCRNLVHKISLEYNNLATQLSSAMPVTTAELLSLSMFLDDNEIIVTDLKNFRTKNKTNLPEEVNSFIDQLINYMTIIHDRVKKTAGTKSKPDINLSTLSDFDHQITAIYNELINQHKWIINYFQQVFAAIQKI